MFNEHFIFIHTTAIVVNRKRVKNDLPGFNFRPVFGDRLLTSMTGALSGPIGPFGPSAVETSARLLQLVTLAAIINYPPQEYLVY